MRWRSCKDGPMTQPSTVFLQEGLSDLIGVAYVRQGSPLDAIGGQVPLLVVEPGSEQEISSVVAWCSQHGLTVAPRGGGTKLGWGNEPRSVDVVLSLERLDRLVEHAHGDMTATVQAGMTLTEFQTQLALHGQMLALDVEHSEHATIGGVIATNDSGALRLRYGGIRDQIIGITVVRADGVVAHGGGRVVKNVAGYDLPKLYTGSLGSLGIITQATFRLYPLPAERRELSVEAESPAEAGRVLHRLLDSTLMPTGLFIEHAVNGEIRVSIRFAGIRESVEAQVAEVERLLGSRGRLPRPLGEGWGAGASSVATAEPSPQPSPRGRGSSGTPAVPGCVLKVSVLPTEIAMAIDRAVAIGVERGWRTEAVVHAHGLGRVTWSTDEAMTSLSAAVNQLRTALGPRGGTVVVLEAPLNVKREMDVWGPATDAVPIMRRVKAELDPNSTLNPGRLIGGI